MSGKDESLPGTSEKACDGSLTVQESFSGDGVISGLADGLSSHLAFQIGNPFMQALAYNTSKYIMLETAQVIFDGLGGFTTGNTLGFSIAQLKVRNELISE